MNGPKRTDRTRLTHDDRAVSIAITHALTIAITTILVSGLLLASGPFLDAQEQRVSQDQLNEIGSSVATQISTVDRLADSGDDVETTVTVQYPTRIVDNYEYTVELREEGDRTIVEVSSEGVDRASSFQLQTNTDIDNGSSTDGPDIEISLCDDNGDSEITLEGCD